MPTDDMVIDMATDTVMEAVLITAVAPSNHVAVSSDNNPFAKWHTQRYDGLP